MSWLSASPFIMEQTFNLVGDCVEMTLSLMTSVPIHHPRDRSESRRTTFLHVLSSIRRSQSTYIIT